jgi:SOS-response transcriptional repressor LexA
LKVFINLLNLNYLSYLAVPMKRQREQVRLNNLEILIAETGSAAKVAQLANTSESYLSQVRRKMRTQKGTPRGLGDELAARLEKGLGKAPGWMDEPHEDETVSSDTHQLVRIGNRVLQVGGETFTVQRPTHNQRSQASDDAGPFEDRMGSSETNEQKDKSKTGKARKPSRYSRRLVAAYTKQRKRLKTSTDTGAEIITLCPLISWAQAGAWLDIADDFEVRQAEDLLPCPVRCSQRTFILCVKGASMEPKFLNGDFVFVDPGAMADSGNYVIVQLEDADESTFKQLIHEGGRTYLKALNPDWPDRIIEINENARICGVVVFKGEMV